MKFVCDSGKAHNIRFEVMQQIDVAFADHIVSGVFPNSDIAQALIAKILRTSEERQLTGREREQLKGADAVININRALHLMRGRDYKEIFGADATVCQIHHNRVTLDCGCHVNFVFDHHKRHDADKELHPHWCTEVCGDHEHMALDFKRHHKHLLKKAK